MMDTMTDRKFHDLMYGPEPEDDEVWPTCDICDEPMDDTPGALADWNGETGNHESCEQPVPERYAVVATYSDASYRTWIVWGNRRKAQRKAADIRNGNHDGLMLVSLRPVTVTA